MSLDKANHGHGLTKGTDRCKIDVKREAYVIELVQILDRSVPGCQTHLEKMISLEGI